MIYFGKVLQEISKNDLLNVQTILVLNLHNMGSGRILDSWKRGKMFDKVFSFYHCLQYTM